MSKKKVITTDQAPAPVGPYNQAIIHENMVFVSGQIPLDPQTGQMAAEDLDGQTHQVMKNLGAVLKAAGADYDNVLKCTIYLSDMNDFARMNELYGSYFGDEPPTREAVAVKTLPKNALVEVSCIAYL